MWRWLRNAHCVRKNKAWHRLPEGQNNVLIGVLFGIDRAVDFQKSIDFNFAFDVKISDGRSRGCRLGSADLNKHATSLVANRLFLNDEFLAFNTFSRRAIDELVAERGAERQEEERIDDPTFALGHDGKRGWGLGTVVETVVLGEPKRSKDLHLGRVVSLFHIE